MSEKGLYAAVASTPLLPTSKTEGRLPSWAEQPFEAPKISAREKFINIQCIFLNTASTVAIVFMNKVVFSDEELRKCQVSIAAWHFSVTAIVLLLAAGWPFNAFPAVRLPIAQMLPICTFFIGFLLLGNLSLAYNNVGFYQLAKIMTTPAVVFLNFTLFGTTVSRKTLYSVIACCIGVGMATTTSLLSNPLGAAFAAAAFTVTAIYQIWIGKKINDLKVSPPQLLLNQAPVSVGVLLVIIPFVDTVPELNRISPRSLTTLIASGIMASLLNLSQFLIIGRTSALTFNIVSNLKTIIIVCLSWYSDGRAPAFLDVCGASLAIGGAYAYAQHSRKK